MNYQKKYRTIIKENQYIKVVNKHSLKKGKEGSTKFRLKKYPHIFQEVNLY